MNAPIFSDKHRAQLAHIQLIHTHCHMVSEQILHKFTLVGVEKVEDVVFVGVHALSMIAGLRLS